MRPGMSTATRWLVVLLTVSAAVAVWLGARHFVGPEIRETHTKFLFAQLDDSYSRFIRTGNKPVASEQSFRDLVAAWTIDWNSCELRDGIIFDSWGTPIQIRTESLTVHLRSAGPDRQFGTRDDIARSIGKGPAAQPANGVDRAAG